MTVARDGASGVLDAARRRLGLSLDQTWVAYLSVGGDASRRDLKAWLSGASPVPDREHNLVAQALNDEAVTQGLPPAAPYRPRWSNAGG